jgi:hypothetical protein
MITIINNKELKQLKKLQKGIKKIGLTTITEKPKQQNLNFNILEEIHENGTTTFKVLKDFDNKKENQKIKNDFFKSELNQLKKDYVYFNDFEKTLNYVLDSEKILKLNDLIKKSKNYKELENFKTIDFNLLNHFREIKKDYNSLKICKESRNKKRLLINQFQKHFNLYESKQNIKRIQHKLINVNLIDNNKTILYDFVFMIGNKKTTESLYLKLNNHSENLSFKKLINKIKYVNNKIIKHNNQNKKGFRKLKIDIKTKNRLIDLNTKMILRFNKKNHNIKINSYMVYLLINHFNLINLCDSDLNTIENTIKNQNIETDYLFKKRAYIFNLDAINNITINIKEKIKPKTTTTTEHNKKRNKYLMDIRNINNMDLWNKPFFLNFELNHNH